LPALVRAGGVMIRFASVGRAVGSTCGIGMVRGYPENAPALERWR
jgi:hypothetical protein